MNSASLRGPRTISGAVTIKNSSITTYNSSANNRWRTGWRSGVWSWASTTESTNAEIADDPAHSEIKKPRDTTSPRAPRSMSRMVGSMISWTTLGEKILFDIDTRRCSMTAMVSGPNSGATYARLPSIPNSSGGRDSADQNAACADSEKIESSQLFDSARRVMRQMWWRDGFTMRSLMTRSGLLTNRPAARIAGGESCLTRPAGPRGLQAPPTTRSASPRARWRGAGRTEVQRRRAAWRAHVQQRCTDRTDQPWLTRDWSKSQSWLLRSRIST